MKIFEKSFVLGIGTSRCVLLALALCITITQSQAIAATISNRNSSVVINTAQGSGGVSDWVVDGGDQLNQQWFYYRVGDNGPEYPIDNISASPTITPSGDNKLTVLYANASFGVSVQYTVAGYSTGAQKSGMTATFKVLNYTGSDLDFHFYQYSDFSLGGAAGGQSANFSTGLDGVTYNKLTQTIGASSFVNTITGLSTPPSVVRADLGNLILASLQDGNPTTFVNNPSAGPGHVTSVWEWDVVLHGQGDSLSLSETMSLTGVPEPSALALVSCGFASLALLRRRH